MYDKVNMFFENSHDQAVSPTMHCPIVVNQPVKKKMLPCIKMTF